MMPFSSISQIQHLNMYHNYITCIAFHNLDELSSVKPAVMCLVVMVDDNPAAFEWVLRVSQSGSQLRLVGDLNAELTF